MSNPAIIFMGILHSLKCSHKYKGMNNLFKLSTLSPGVLKPLWRKGIKVRL